MVRRLLRRAVAGVTIEAKLRLGRGLRILQVRRIRIDSDEARHT